MIDIHFIDDDVSYYTDLKIWLPDYCNFKKIKIEEMENIESFINNITFILINPNCLFDKNDYINILIKYLNKISVIFVSDEISLPFVVDVIKSGACDFFQKKRDKSLIVDSIHKILLDQMAPVYINSDLNHKSLQGIIGQSNSIIKLKNDILEFCENDINILLQGETGSGKELTANAIHSYNNNDNSIIAVNCGAIPENLIESELFGTIKGAFTDAQNRKGYFEKANGGTLFLDEIAELSLTAQVKLLRVIESGHFFKVGDSNIMKSTFRLITATNKNLKDEVNAGRFRDDLFYRITPFIIDIPPLRKRKKDIFDLSIHFLKNNKSIKKLSNSALVKLLHHKWPGNVRELKQTIFRANLLSKKEKIIDAKHIVFY